MAGDTLLEKAHADDAVWSADQTLAWILVGQPLRWPNWSAEMCRELLRAQLQLMKELGAKERIAWGVTPGARDQIPEKIFRLDFPVVVDPGGYLRTLHPRDQQRFQEFRDEHGIPEWRVEFDAEVVTPATALTSLQSSAGVDVQRGMPPPEPTPPADAAAAETSTTEKPTKAAKAQQIEQSLPGRAELARLPGGGHLVAKPEAVSPSAGTATAEALQFEERIEGAVEVPGTDAREGEPAPKPEQPTKPDSPPAKDPGGRKDYEWSELDTRWTREGRTFPNEKLLKRACEDEVLRFDRERNPRPGVNTVKAAIAAHKFNKFLETDQ
jgi:hypothetical protein